MACANCNKKIEDCWGCREENWGICQTCHVELLATCQGGTVELRKAPDNHNAGQVKPMTVEITLTMDILVEQGNNVHKWFDLQIAEKARAMGIRDEFFAAAGPERRGPGRPRGHL